MAGARLAELRLSANNRARSGTSVEGESSRRTYPLIVLVHGVTIGATLFFGRNRPVWPWLLLLLAVQPIRAWVLLTLGSRWNTRGAVPEEMEVETGGPYRFVRHPNYSVVGIELLALPMAFGLRRLALLATVTNAFLLSIRIRDEERLLRKLHGYDEHFADKRRFLPGLF